MREKKKASQLVLSERLSLLRSQLALAKKYYDENGYVIIPGVFSEDDISIIKLMAYQLAQEQACRMQYANGHPALLFWPKDVSAALKDICEDPRLKTIVEYFLGTEIFQINNQIYFREAGDEDQFAWHQDLSFRTPVDEWDSVEHNYLQTIIVVDEMHPDNGAIEFMPGSHKLGVLNLIPRDNSERGLRDFVRGAWRGTKINAMPGDVVLWHSLTVHGSEKNISTSNRMTYMNGFAREKSVLNKKRYPRYATNF